MNWSKSIRQTHRWLSLTFTLLVVVNIVLNFIAVPEQVTFGVGILTLLPLALLMLTGLYLFALPYATRRRAARSAGSDSHDR